MDNEVTVSDIDKIIKGLEILQQAVSALHTDLSNFKIDISGKVKGNQELITQKIESIKTESVLKQQLLEEQIKNNKTEIFNNKGRISEIYQLDRDSTKRNDDANAKIIEDLDSKFEEFFSKISPKLDQINENKIKINILFGGVGAVLIALVYIIGEGIVNGG